MDRIFTQASRPVSEIAFAAIAVRNIENNQRHIGILYREGESQEVMLLHLAWHHVLRNHAPGLDCVWIDPMVPKRRLRHVAALCRKVWRSNQGTLPYAFSPPNDCFDSETGAFLMGPTRHGLTCASFVLAVFGHAGLHLVDYATWPINRPGDREWQKSIVSMLERSEPSVSAEHISTLKTEIGAARFRPEEVAGAATVSPLPADFRAAEIRGNLVLQRLRDLPQVGDYAS